MGSSASRKNSEVIIVDEQDLDPEKGNTVEELNTDNKDNLNKKSKKETRNQQKKTKIEEVSGMDENGENEPNDADVAVDDTKNKKKETKQNNDSDDDDADPSGSSKKKKKTDEEVVEKWKPKVTESAEYLNSCEDYTTEECFEKMGPLFEACKLRRVRKLLGVYVTDELKLAELFIKVWKSLACENVYDESENKQPSKNLKRFKMIYWNFTDTSAELCHSMHNNHALELLLDELDNPLLAVEELRSDSRRYHVKGTLGILNNSILKCDKCRESYRKANAVERISKYGQSTFLIIKAKVLLLLSYIVDENESEALAATDGSIAFLLNLLREALKSTTTHIARSYGLGVAELLQGLSQLTGLENNKVKIGIQGGIYLMCKILVLGYSEEEQILAAKILWNLAFVEINKDIIKLCEEGTNGK